MRRLFVAAAFAVLSATAFALPTVDDVQAEVNKGHYAQAEEMMREVVAARPGSARAHYVYAEILAHDRRFELAAEQAAQARKLDPAIKFTQPDKFSAFEQLLEREQAAARRAAAPAPALRPDSVPAPAVAVAPAPAASGGIPGWVWALGLMAVAFGIWRVLSSRQQAQALSPAGYGAAGVPAAAGAGAFNAPGSTGYGPGYGGYGQPGVPPAAPGRGMLGTGLAVAGGVAAGMLAEKLLDGRHDAGLGGLGGSTAAPGLAGMAPGLLGGGGDDNPAARELEDRPVDFGSGDGWGSGDDAGGGSSGSDDGGW